MREICDWAAIKLADGSERTAKNLFECLYEENPSKTRYVKNNMAISYALKADGRFRCIKREHGVDLFRLA